MSIIDVLTRVQRIDDEQTQITITDEDTPTSTLYRKIHIGNYQTPPDTLGEDGDIYIYKP